MKTFCKLSLELLLILNISACKSDPTSIVKDATVIISGDLTYDKLVDALAPFVNNNKALVSDNEDGFLTKKIAIDRDLKKISISSVIDLVFVQSDKVSATLKIPNEWVKYYHVSYFHGVLEIGPEENASLNVNDHLHHVKLYVSAPNLSDLNLSGVCTAKIEDISTNSDFNITCSGMGNVAIRSLIGRGMLKIKNNGASNIAIKALNVESFDAEISGVSKTAVESMEAKNVKANVSGVSNFSLNGNCDHVSMIVAGTSKSHLSGKANSAEMNASGISKIDLSGFLCSNIKKDVSDMSHIKD